MSFNSTTAGAPTAASASATAFAPGGGNVLPFTGSAGEMGTLLGASLFGLLRILDCASISKLEALDSMNTFGSFWIFQILYGKQAHLYNNIMRTHALYAENVTVCFPITAPLSCNAPAQIDRFVSQFSLIIVPSATTLQASPCSLG